MRRRHRRPRNVAADLDITAFMNLMVILVPFLLITAVFSRMAILEVNLPDSGTAVEAEEETILQVTLRETGIDVGDSRGIVAQRIEKVDNAFDYAALGEWIAAQKEKNPEEVDAILLLEPDVPYDALIQAMDQLRIGPPDENGEPSERFPAISLGPAAIRPEGSR